MKKESSRKFNLSDNLVEFNLPIIESNLVPDDKIYVINNTFITKLPNTLSVSRDEWEGEDRWEKCRGEQQASNYKLCDECHERFRCWTACRPNEFETLRFKFDELAKVMAKTGITVKGIDEAWLRVDLPKPRNQNK